MSAFGVGQLIGYLILVAVVVGVVRTLQRKDLSMREKLIGRRRRR